MGCTRRVAVQAAAAEARARSVGRVALRGSESVWARLGVTLHGPEVGAVPSYGPGLSVLAATAVAFSVQRSTTAYTRFQSAGLGLRRRVWSILGFSSCTGFHHPCREISVVSSANGSASAFRGSDRHWRPEGQHTGAVVTAPSGCQTRGVQQNSALRQVLACHPQPQVLVWAVCSVVRPVLSRCSRGLS